MNLIKIIIKIMFLIKIWQNFIQQVLFAEKNNIKEIILGNFIYYRTISEDELKSLINFGYSTSSHFRNTNYKLNKSKINSLDNFFKENNRKFKEGINLKSYYESLKSKKENHERNSSKHSFYSSGK